MIFVGGMGRSGTSVMMECLRLSGFNIGPPELLHGHKYGSEYSPMFYTLEWVTETLRAGGIYKDIFEFVSNVATYVVDKEVQALKVLKLGFYLQLLKEHEIMDDPMFVLMSRDLQEAVESANRMGASAFTESTFKTYLQLWDDIADGYPTIRIDHHDLVYEKEKTKDRLSEFIGREIDMSIVSPKETHAGSGGVH